MQIAAQAALDAGGNVIGVITEQLMVREVGHPGLTELRVVPTMHERKALMANYADAFIALPGGFGTFDELCEMATWDQLGIHVKPLALVNIEGYFDGFLAQIDRARRRRLVKPEHRTMLAVAATVDEVLAALDDVAGARGAEVAAGSGRPSLDAAAVGDAARRRGARCAACWPTSTTRSPRTAQLTPDAYAALARLRAAGMLVIPITGRPAGWCDHIARMWPVDAVVGENGAFYMRYDAPRRKLVKRFLADDAARAANRARLAAIGAEILRAVPGAALASDQHYRESDLAIDFCEDVPPLPRAEVDRIVAMMEAEGMTAKVSSIHVNGWFGRYDKLGDDAHAAGGSVRDRPRR